MVGGLGDDEASVYYNLPSTQAWLGASPSTTRGRMGETCSMWRAPLFGQFCRTSRQAFWELRVNGGVVTVIVLESSQFHAQGCGETARFR